MEAIFTNINNALAAMGANANTSQAVLALVAVGTIAMAVLQVIKELTPVRRWFQRQWLQRWLDKKMEAEGTPAISWIRSLGNLPAVFKSATGVEKVLLDLATGGDRKAFYDLPAEQLVAQMNAAAQIALDYPEQHRTLLAVLSHGASVDDVSRILVPTAPLAESPSAVPDTSTLKTYLDARTRVGHRIQRNLDAVQIAMGNRWKFWMQVSSIVIATGIIQAAVVHYLDSPAGQAVTPRPDKLSVLIGAAILGIVGGYLAPVTRDLVAALQKLRK